MRVWIVAQEIPPEDQHGSAPLVERLAAHLPKLGVTPHPHRARPGPNVSPSPEPPDVVHVVDSLRSGASVQHLSGHDPGVPLVLTLDSPSLEEDLARPERLAATRHLIERAAIVTVQSESARRLFERVFPAAPNPPHVVLPRAHLPERRPDGQVATVRLKDVPPQATLALVLSAPRPRLDPIPLIEAVSALKSRGASIHLAFAGAPRDAHLDVMLTASSSLYRYVHRLGRVPRGGMKTLIERADLVLCPSEGDSYPQALIEAMASGRAIIARERTPTTELCRDGKEAFLYHDAEGLLTALERLHEDAAARATLGAAAAARYAEGGSAADEAARYHALYKAALEAAPGET